jgi:hypothetical protein
MSRGWHGNSAGHARAGQLGGRKSAESRRTRSQFGEQLIASPKAQPQPPSPAKPPQSGTTT